MWNVYIHTVSLCHLHMKHEFVIYAPNVRIKEMHWHTYCTFSFPPQVAMPVETLRLGWELNASHMSAVTAWEPGITFKCTVLAASNWPEDRRISKYSASSIRKRQRDTAQNLNIPRRPQGCLAPSLMPLSPSSKTAKAKPIGRAATPKLKPRSPWGRKADQSIKTKDAKK